MIYDCFNFYNELELLDIRLNELDSIIDKFILVESTVTFTSNKKPLFYELNKAKFKKFHNKIIHIIVDDSPNVLGNPWIIENHQLNAITRGMVKCHPTDTILVSCVDEIPKKEKIIEWKDKQGKHKVLLQNLSYYYLNLFAINYPWEGTRIFKYKDLKSYQSPYIARFSPIDVKIEDGGWHFSFIGDVKNIQQKLSAYSHQEYNNPKYNTREKILLAIKEGKDLFNRDIKFEPVDYSKLPDYINSNRELYKQFLIDPNSDNELLKNLDILLLKITDLLRKQLRQIKKIIKN